MTIRNTKLLAAALCLSTSTFCVADQSYRLTVRVERNGESVLNTTATLATGGKNFDFEAIDDVISSQTDVTSRIIARVDADNNEYFSDNNEYLVVHLLYLEQRQSTWQLLGQPTFEVAVGSEGSGEFSATPNDLPASQYKISVAAVKADPVSE